MSFKLGLVGLCTSHPDTWVPIIREMSKEGLVDIEIVAAWDSGETREAGFAAEFCKNHNIPHVVENLTDMVDMVDGVIVHTTNWDKHIEQAVPFVEADKAVLIDKPIVGNMKDANTFLDWMKQGKRVTGGSSLRFCQEVKELLVLPVDERGTVHTAYTAIGVDDMNYGIHGYAIVSGLMGPGIHSVQYLGSSSQKQLMLEWNDGRIVLMTVGKNFWLPFNVTAVTDKNAYQISVDNSKIYRSLLEAQLPYLTGMTDELPLSADEILEPELAAIAARQSWINDGQKVFLTDLRQDDPGYDGDQFAREYRRTRLG
ncbi:MAG: Gfo/Idh/MocA family oxidoreductase [Victivallaceae bacterium]|nr:Gfo/Idh/MocA family oxidoreductase [Victivallaceae bacterium]